MKTRRWRGGVVGIVLLILLGVLAAPGIGSSGGSQTIHAQSTGGTAMLAVMGTDGNLYLYDANGQNPIALTTDAVPDRKTYSWGTWATDGRLAFFGFSFDPADPYTLRVFVRPAGGGAYRTAYTSLDEIFTYACWSPADCAGGGETGCRDLALLFTPADQQALALRLIRDQGETFSERLVGRAAPFYYSFSPDGKSMLWHRFARQLERYDIESGETTRLADSPGAFQAPMWSPVDDRLLFAVRGEEVNTNDLVIAEGDNRTTILSGQPSTIAFAWSPDGQKVAATVNSSTLIVIDVAGGITLNMNQSGPALAYFWSPNSDKIAFLSLKKNDNAPIAYRSNGHQSPHPPQQSPHQFTWYVLDVAANKTDVLADFTPTAEMLYYLNFADQFSRSHRLWSPDGRYFAYGSMEGTGTAGVYLADVTAPGTTTRIGDGTIGIWSW
ncbi:MAG TPA: hypothetical protein PLD47_08835 [Aggregatilineales bacterium]|nr:hypothetical protein [Anaerolineales bacterium]HRE47818.1 hypothetical protein [Aggregatilineales bacterium]